MKRFITLKADGITIAARGQCADGDVAIQPVPAGGSIVILDDSQPTPDHLQQYDPATKTFAPALGNVKRNQADALKAAMLSYIQSSFVSSAKSAGLIYDSSQVEQLNMVLSAATAAGGGIWCKANANGVFAPQAHTQAQARGVVQDFIAFRDAAFTKAATLGNQIRNASTVAEAQAIIW